MKKLTFILAALIAAASSLFAENNPFHDSYQWTAVPDHADWLYKTGEKANVTVTLLRYGMPVEGQVVYTIGDDMLEPDRKDSLMLRHGSVTINAGTSRKPCFRDIVMYYKDDQGGSHQYHLKLGFDVDKITPRTKEPADFTAFWDKAKAEIATPLSCTRTRLDEFSTGSSECYKVRINTVDRHAIYGYLYMPKNAAKGSCPVLTCPPGAGIKHIEPHNNDGNASLGIITFQFEIHGIDPQMSAEDYRDINAAFIEQPCSYNRFGIEDKDRYYFRHVYQGLVKAIDMLTSLPEWDGRNVIAYGGSQGGALSLISAGLDSRVTACVAYYPALVEMSGYSVKGQMGGYPHFKKDMSIYTAKALETLPYYDVISFVRHIKVPTFLSFGYCDSVCPPSTSYMVWNTLDCPKELFTMPFTEHWSNEAGRCAAVEFIKKNLR